MATPPLNPHSASPFLFLLLLTSAVSATTTNNPDLNPLITFKAASDPSNRLSDWHPSAPDPCNFTGVTCHQNRVTRLVLENLNLTTSHLHPLASLTHLRVLSLKSNSLSGHLPDSLSNLTHLKLLFLSHNKFSGQFPLPLLSLSRLYRLDLANNNFSGAIPAGPTTLGRLTHLLTLRLEENHFTGSISSLVLPPSLRDFNVSGNRLSGGIPDSMSGFPASAFSRNSALCGAPLVQPCKSGSLDPTMPGSGGGGGGAIPSPGSSKPNQVVASSPSSLPTAAAKEAGNPTTTKPASKIGPAAVIAIILGDVLVLAVVSLLLYCYFWRNYAAKMKLRKLGGPAGKTTETEKIVYSSTPYPNPNPNPMGPRTTMVFFDGAKRFELEDLLRASAEMLGKGAFGTAYKAVLDDGNVVAVKRLKDANLVGGAAAKFEQQMEVLGRLRHPNLVSLRAYYFAREEKLLVYDYMANGSLFWLLHGNRGPGRTPLDWTTRLKISAGAARGLSFIHSSCKPLKLTHANIKSTNILLDRSGNARVSDFGFSTFSSAAAASKTNGYRAPESGSDPRKLTQKSDVYSFGVLLLELLTGKCPSSMADCGGYGGGGGGGGGVVDLPRWVQSVVREEWTAEVFDLELMRYKDIEEEMVGLLQIAMTCTSPVPDQRPKMGQVVKMIEELRGAEVSPAHDETFDSVSDSPSLSEDTTCGATSQ